MRPGMEPKPPRDFVGDALKSRKGNESVEDLLLRAVRMLSEEESTERLGEYERGLRMPPAEESGMELGAGKGAAALRKDKMPDACEMGECEHPEHQHEDALPEEI